MKNFTKKLFVATVLTGTILNGDVVVNDDHIVTESECVGMDCVNGEVFNFDTLRLKENNLRIGFIDTSNSGSFPTNDWQITINDSSNGGENYFAVDDTTGGKKLFKISSDGRIAMGSALDSTFLLSTSGDLTIHGTLSDSSDVNLKENIIPVDNAEVLQKISELPISTWNYKDNKQKDKHIGAMAQDFYKAFEYGPDNLHIAPKDAAFVAVAGVQELVKKLDERDKTIQELQEKVKELETLQITLKNLEAMVGILLQEGSKKSVAFKE